MSKQAKAKPREDARTHPGSNGGRGPRGVDTAQSVLDSSRQIWLAGLGAFSRAQAEGRKMFDGLVSQGEVLEKETRHVASSTARAAREAAMGGAARVHAVAGETWEKLEKVFEDRVAQAMAKLGVHSRSEVDSLAARVDALTAAVNELVRTSGRSQSARASSRAPAAGKPAAAKKPAAARKPAAAKTPGSTKTVDAAGKATARKRASRVATRG